MYISVIDAEEVYCVVKRGDFLGSEKVVNIPGISNGMTALTGQDEEDIRTGIRLKVDAIAIPGARNADFIDDVKRFLCKRVRAAWSSRTTDVAL